VSSQSTASAVYLPAISKGFAAEALKGLTGSYGGISGSDLNFLDPANPHFHYPYGLYSAGQHNTKAAQPAPDIVSQRDRSATTIVGDSGGFQCINDEDYFTPAITLHNMRWMESVADYSATLEFPTAGIASGKMRKHAERLMADGHPLQALNGQNRLGLDYNACLVQTKLNNDDFVKHRTPGATQFLNVLQGRSEAESSYWYEAVKHYPFEGWALAGRHQVQFSMSLARLLDIRRDGLLAGTKWIHFLGVGTLPIGVLLSKVQQVLRLIDNSTIQISFDTASPFRLGAYHNMTAGLTLDKQGWSTQSVSPRDLDPSSNLGDALAVYLDGKVPDRNRIVSRTAVSRAVTVGDLFYPGTQDLTPDAYHLMTHHNVEALIDAHSDAHDKMFGGIFQRDPLGIPMSLQTLAVMIEDILSSPDAEARKKIIEWRHHLDVLGE
jgi:hypothetical protein